MKKLMLLCYLLMAFTNCENKAQTNEAMESTESAESKVSGELQVGCYAYKGNNSAITFEITKIAYSITGTLNYHLAEKDANTGTFEGFLIDDVLLGDYTFQSEGITSKREVIFKIINGQLIEGFGPMDEEGICFINTDHVTYTPTMPLSKTKCPN